MTRHIVALSGGKDSAAMAILLSQSIPNLELAFCDTGRELPEVYSYVAQVGAVIGKPVRAIQYCGRDFDWYLREFKHYLPDSRNRWCTKHLKIVPFERYLGKQEATVYIGIRADEDRAGNYGLRRNVEYAYPLHDQGIDRQGVVSILEAHTLPLPDFYRWRSTGGCWCCPFQRKSDWAGLRLFHPDLFSKAAEDEQKSIEATGRRFGWLGNGKPLTRLEAAWQPPLTDAEDVDGRCLICAK